jgi:hypothetical protein
MGKLTKEEIESFKRQFPHFWQWAWEERRFFHNECKYPESSGVTQEESNAFELEFATVVVRCLHKSPREAELAEEFYRQGLEELIDREPKTKAPAWVAPGPKWE